MCGMWERDGTERQWQPMRRVRRYVDVQRDGVS